MSTYLRTLGGLSLHLDGPESEPLLTDSKSLVIVALLAVAPDHSMRRDHLAELLWPGIEHEKARRSLRQSLYYLSKQTGRDVVSSDNAHVTLSSEFDCDLWRFDRAVQDGDYGTVTDAFDGRFLESVERKLGHELCEWTNLQNQRLRSARREAFQHVIDDKLESGKPGEAERHARRYAEMNPLDDPAQICLLETLKAIGDEAGAFQTYEEYRSLLLSAVGDEPSEAVEATIASARRVLTADDTWKPIAAAPPESLSRGTARRYATAVFVGGTAIGAGALAIGFAMWPNPHPPVPVNTSIQNVSVTLLVERLDSPTEWRELRIDGEEVETRPFDRCVGLTQPGRLLSPDLRYAALVQNGPAGRDLVLHDCATGERRPLLTGPADERPIAWAPDGRELLVGLGRMAPDGRYQQELVRLDLESGASQTVFRPDAEADGWGAWSNRGDRLAYSTIRGSRSELYVMGIDGANPRRLATGVDWVGIGAWSPDDRLIVFGGGGASLLDLYVIPSVGGEPEPLTQGLGTPADIEWLSTELLAVVLRDGGKQDLWIIDRFTREKRRITLDGRVGSIIARLPVPREGEWVERVLLHAPKQLSPGMIFAPRVQLLLARGDTVDPASGRLRWETSDSALIRPLSGDRWQVMGEGEAELLVTAGGWRSDTVQVLSSSILMVENEPSLEEDWRAGIRDSVWVPFGDPAPTTSPVGGEGGGGRFLNNGDQNYASGVVSARSFSTGRGLTIEAWGKVPFTAPNFQNLDLGLSGDGLEWSESGPVAWLKLNLHSAGGGEFALSGSRRARFPGPDDPAGWHRYAVQAWPSGRVDMLVDGRLLWWEDDFVRSEDIPARARVMLSGRSIGTRILHGSVRVWEGIRYRLAEHSRVGG